MELVVPDDLARASGLGATELRVELAVALFRDDRLTLGQAARLAGMAQASFLDILGARKIPLHYGLEELEQDLKTIERLFPR